MIEDPQAITYLGETNFRNRNTRFGIKTVDRSRHMYVIGKSGTGKSTFLETMAIQDIERGSGLVFLDPHGGSGAKLLEYIPEWRKQDVIYFAPFDMDFPLSFNIMEDVGKDRRHLVSNGLMSAFKKIWVDAWSARMEYILNNILLALLEYPGATILGVNRMLSDKDYRKMVVANVSDPSVKSFWIDEFARYSDKYMQEAGAAIQNKIGQFVTNPLIRNIVGQERSSFDFRQAMDERKIVIINLSKGQMGDQNASLLGAMLITKIYLSAMSRADVPPHIMATLPSFYFYADEFQNFANESFADILSEARKYKLCLTIAHQYVEQLPEELQSAVFGNVGSMVVFRVGAQDAEIFEKEFAPVFLQDDFTNLAFRHMYLRISIDGVGSKPFSAQTLMMSPNTSDGSKRREEIIELSRKSFAHPRAEVESAIQSWYGPSMAGSGSEEKGKYPPRAERGESRSAPAPVQRPPMDPNKPTFVSRDNGPHPVKTDSPKKDSPIAKAMSEALNAEPKSAPKALEVKPMGSASKKDPEPKPVSPTLANLISKLDEDGGGKSPVFEESQEIPQMQKVGHSTSSTQRTDLKNLTQKSWNDRSASDDKKQSLKDILAKALAGAPKTQPTSGTTSIPVSTPKSQPVSLAPHEQPFMKLSDLKIASFQKEKEETNQSEENSTPGAEKTISETPIITQPKPAPVASTAPTFISRTPKEVPENILKSVLE